MVGRVQAFEHPRAGLRGALLVYHPLLCGKLFVGSYYAKALQASHAFSGLVLVLLPAQDRLPLGVGRSALMGCRVLPWWPSANWRWPLIASGCGDDRCRQALLQELRRRNGYERGSSGPNLARR